MKKKGSYKFLVIAFLIIIVVVSLLSVEMPSAAPEQINGGKNSKSFELGDGAVFKGVFSSYSWYFESYKWWNLDESKADIFFNVTQLIDDKKEATLTFSVNGTPFYSTRIVYKEEIQNIKLVIPKSLIKDGSNELKIEGYLRISDKPCEDDNNNGNWVTIQGKSNIVSKFTDKEPKNYINEFPYPFFKVNDSSTPNSAIVVSDNFEEQHISAAFLLSSYLGNINKYGDYNGAMFKYSDLKDNTLSSLVYIGSSKDIPNDIRTITKGVEGENLKENAIIKLGNSPYNKNGENNKLLCIISDNNDLLKNAVKFLMNEELVSQVKSDTFKVSKDTKVEIVTREENEILTFKDLGVNEMQLKGPFRRSAKISYFLPKNKEFADEAKIKLFMRYSDNLDFTRSLVTVYMNGTPIGSKKLEKNKANGDEAEFKIPVDIKKTSYIEATVSFDLEITDSYCQFRQEEMPWALVTSDSYLHIKNKNIDFYSFDKYPNPFITDRSFNNVAIIIPDKVSSEELTALSLTFANMGKSLKYTDGNLDVVKSSNFKDTHKSMNLILYGTPQNNNAIKSNNNNLWFKYNEDYSSFLSNEKLYLTNPFASKIAIYQFDVSPYNKGRGMLVITSPNEYILRKSLVYLYSYKESLKATGDSLVIDEDGGIKTFKFKKETNKLTITQIQNLDTATKGLLAVVVLFIIFLIVSLVLYKNKYRNK